MPHPHETTMDWGPDLEMIGDKYTCFRIHQENGQFYIGKRKNGTYDHGPFETSDDAEEKVLELWEAYQSDRYDMWRADV